MNKLKFTRRYTGDGQLANIKWVRREALITENDRIVFKQSDVRFPDFWSQQAINICSQKYFRKTLVPMDRERVLEDGIPEQLCGWKPAPNTSLGGETGYDEVAVRLAGCWTYWGWKEGLFASLEDAQAFRDEVIWLLVHQYLAPNSPQFFNTGLHWAYGITGGAQGFWYADEDGTLHQSMTRYERMAAHACYINRVEDDLVNEGGIMDLWVREARIFKMGGGSGVNPSKIRGTGEPLSGGGTASGLLSWLRIGDTSAGGIKSGGDSRRAAKMVCVDVDHPDIEEFIDWKVREEDKVAFLTAGSELVRRCAEEIRDTSPGHWDNEEPERLAAREQVVRSGLDQGVPAAMLDRLERLLDDDPDAELPEVLGTDWRGEAYRTIQGQNANNSIRVSNAFMRAVEADADWQLIRRTDGQVARTIKARHLWKKICVAAWKCADPGIQFDTTINEWNPTPELGRIDASNPCSEYNHIPDTACNLASLNLLKFLLDTGVFDVEEMIYATRLATVILETTVAMAHLPSKETAINTARQRQLGLGYANLGALLMSMGSPYDSDRGRAIAAAVTCVLHCTTGCMSAEMAQAVEPFADYGKCEESFLKVMRNHRAAAYFDFEEKGHYEGIEIERPRMDLALLASDMRTKDLGLIAREQASEMVALGELHGYRNAQFSVLAPTGTISFIMDCDTTGMEPDFALVKYKTLAGGGMMKIVNQSVPRALRFLGYSPEHVINISKYVEDNGWIEGAPGFNEEHLAVFDCAMPSKSGRCVSPTGHLLMLAAVQPFLSGSSSKTINLPVDSTVEDFSEAYMAGWRLGCDCVAAYRDHSKMNQPLMTKQKTEHASGKMLRRGEREKLPDRRELGYTQKFRIAGMKVYLRTGNYPDGRLGEIWLDTHKDGATFAAVLHILSIVVSLGLQHGVPLEEYVESFTDVKFEPNGIVQGHKQIKMATSLIDMIFRDLAITYLKRDDLANVPVDAEILQTEVHRDRPESPKVKPNSNGYVHNGHYTGEACSSCGNFTMRRTGPCSCCETCGATSGCS